MKVFFLFITFSLSQIINAQEHSFSLIKNVPALEVYDLLKDRDGYIWLAHDFGISRYDGINFTNFSHPEQNALSMTDLFEDREGRIWCHNFEGQIFYVDNFKLHLLKDYLFAEEPSYPRTGVCKNEMIATSSKGLFVCDTKTLSSKYILIEGGTSAMCVLQDRVLLYGKGKWYCYEPGQAPKRVFPSNFTIDKTEGISLGIRGFNDTAFLISNPEASYCQLVVKDDQLVRYDKEQVRGFINTITIVDSNVWIHTKSGSYGFRKGDTLYNHNITDIVRDDQGNLFYSNLKNGLIAQYSSPVVSKINISFLGPDDYVKKIISLNSGFLCGTQKGKLFLLSKDFNKIREFELPSNEAPVECLFSVNEDEFIVGVPVGLFWLNIRQNKFGLIDNSVILKDAEINNSDIVLATTKGAYKTSYSELSTAGLSSTPLLSYKYLKTGRTRSVQGNEDGSVLLASFSDGVYEFKNGSAKPLLFNGHRVYSTVIRYLNKKFLIGTFSQGIFIVDEKGIRNISTADGLIANSIRGIKIAGDHAWIIFNGFIQKMNGQMELVPTPEIPFKGSLIYDLAETTGNILITTGDGLYKINESERENEAGATKIDLIVVNGKDTAGNTTTFPHNMNNLQIVLSTPYYRPFSLLRYKYRFYKDADTSWKISEDNEKSFNMITLSPGKYLFEAVGINAAGQPVAKALKQTIEILPAWYQTDLFKVTRFVLMLVLLGSFIWFYYRIRLRKERSKYEKMLAVQQERQRISSEMHDDIGAGLSGVRLLTEMTRNKLKDKGTTEDIDKIYRSVGDISAKMKEVIWSLNADNDDINNLVYYIQKQVKAQLENYPGELVFDIPEVIPDMSITGGIRRNIYLLVKESVHNIIKHSGADRIKISIQFKGMMIISIADNGKGFGSAKNYNAGNGMKNMRNRIQQLNGQLFLKNEKGLTLIFEIPLNPGL